MRIEKLKTELDRIVEDDNKIANEFETKSIVTTNFVKKLLGQIVFLYFLQMLSPWNQGRIFEEHNIAFFQVLDGLREIWPDRADPVAPFRGPG